MLALILLIFACVLFIVAACGVASKFNLVAAGLACWVASHLVTAMK